MKIVRGFGRIAPLALTALLASATPAAAAGTFGFGAGAPGSGTEHMWPACTSPSQQYCVESATNAGAPANAQVWILDSGNGTTVPASLDWQIAAPVPGEASIVIRVGTFTPRYTYGISDGISISTATDASNNTKLTISGRVTGFDWNFGIGCNIGACGNESTLATISGLGFSGNTQDMGTDGWADVRSRFEGMAVATNAQVTAPVVQYASFPNRMWLFSVANPHLTTTGAPASGSFTAYVPPNYFTETGIDPTTTAFTVIRDDAGSLSPVTSTSADDGFGGWTLRIDDLHYSAPKLSVKSVAKASPVTIAAPTAVVTSTSVKVSAKVAVNGKGKVAVTGVTRNGTAATTRCTASSKTFTRAGSATITCTIGSTGRAALRSADMLLGVRAKFTPTGKSSVTAVRAVKIARHA